MLSLRWRGRKKGEKQFLSILSHSSIAMPSDSSITALSWIIQARVLCPLGLQLSGLQTTSLPGTTNLPGTALQAAGLPGGALQGASLAGKNL